MMMDVGPCFYGFTLDGVREEAVLCHILWSHYKTKFLNSHRAGHGYSKHHLRVNLDISSFNFAVASPNKKIIIIIRRRRRIWRIGGISVVSKNHEND